MHILFKSSKRWENPRWTEFYIFTWNVTLINQKSAIQTKWECCCRWKWWFKSKNRFHNSFLCIFVVFRSRRRQNANEYIKPDQILVILCQILAIDYRILYFVSYPRYAVSNRRNFVSILDTTVNAPVKMTPAQSNLFAYFRS